MKTRCTLLAACMLCLGLAACGDSSLLTPESPRFNGSTAGSGNRTETTPTTTSTTETTVGGVLVERNGSTAGSGN